MEFISHQQDLLLFYFTALVQIQGYLAWVCGSFLGIHQQDQLRAEPQVMVDPVGQPGLHPEKDRRQLTLASCQRREIDIHINGHIILI